MLRWFVGSSNSRRSGLANIAAANIVLTLQPPVVGINTYIENLIDFFF
jgi:hypothetical protein